MRRLILLRHAKTEPWYEGVDDHGRALTERGREDAMRVAEAVHAWGWTPDLALVSTARRARETWAEVGKVFPEAALKLDEALYLAGPSGIENLISENEAADTLLVIGHNPGFHDIAREIQQIAGTRDHAAAQRLSEKFPTACAALFEAEEDSAFVPALFKLVAVFRPKDFRDEV